MMLNVDFMLRLLVAGILGAIIGLDREYRAKEAGYRVCRHKFSVTSGKEGDCKKQTKRNDAERRYDGNTVFF